MKIKEICPICLKEAGGHLLQTSSNKNCYGFTEYSDLKDYQTFKCGNNHTFYAIYRRPDYTFLFDDSIKSFKNGYYYESIATAYSAYERFNRIIVLTMIYSETKDIAKTDEIFKNNRRNSTIIEGMAQTNLESKFEITAKPQKELKKLRNDTLHGYQIASKDNAQKVMTYVFKYINEVELKFQQMSDENQYFLTSYYNKRISKFKNLNSSTGLFKNSLIDAVNSTSIISPDIDRTTFSDSKDELFDQILNYKYINAY